MASARAVPTINIAPLFEPPSSARDAVDRRLAAAAVDLGIMAITGLPEDIRYDATTRNRLLSLFEAPRRVIDQLCCNRSDPSRPLVYRGWLERREDRPYHYDGMEIGPDVARVNQTFDPVDPLQGPTPMPSESDLPGWREAVQSYFLGMERGANAVMGSIARGLELPEEGFSQLFDGGLSALRLLRYPVRSQFVRAQVDREQLHVTHEGAEREIINEAHVDFGSMTLLAQDESGGLQARLPDGTWIDVPPLDQHLVVNFGKLLERWTSGRIRATEHRVLSPGRERFSLPFFYEPRVDAEIKPLPLKGSEPFVPFLYGDHVWVSLPRLRRLFGEGKPELTSS